MEIIKQVSERAGISEQQAQQAIEGLNDSFRTNLPSPLADAIGGLLSGGGPSAGGAGADDLLGALGGLLGGSQGQGQAGGLGDLLGGLMGGAQGGAQPGNQSPGLDDLLGGLMGGTQGQQGQGSPQGQAGGLGDLLGGLMGGAQGQQGQGSPSLGLDDLIGMIAGGGAQGGLNLDSLVNVVTDRSGVSPDIAQVIIQVVMEFLGGNLPGPLGDALRSITGGQPGAGAQGGDSNVGLDDIARGLGGLLGNQ
jgi:hypothetical protein